MTSGGPSSAQRTVIVSVIALIAATTLVFGFFHFRQSVASPFARDESLRPKTVDELEAERERALREQDSDNDTLNDYDELYIFRTSPFLADTDSDGQPDNVEVAASTDPNCPAGRTCRQVRAGDSSGASGSNSGGATASQLPNVSQQEAEALDAIQDTLGDITKLSPEEVSDRLLALSSAELRNFLLRLGIPQEALDKADDETLRESLKDVLVGIPTGEGEADTATGQAGE